jgi:hypothetical protein
MVRSHVAISLVLETASAMVDDHSLWSRLVEIARENLGWLSLRRATPPRCR